MDRKDLLVNKDKIRGEAKMADEFRILLGYNIQRRKVENIFQKHWEILLRDRVLGGALPPAPKFVYKKAPNLRNFLAPSVLDPPNKGT